MNIVALFPVIFFLLWLLTMTFSPINSTIWAFTEWFYIKYNYRLKNWLATQAEREKEAAARKRKKLERMCEEPKHEFKDDAYFKELSELPKRVEDAVLQGLQASCSTKRPSENDKKKKPKKRKLW